MSGQADIGLIGLGVMGRNLALNMMDSGFRVAVFNRTTSVTDAFAADPGTPSDKVIPCSSLEDLVAHIRPPRPIFMMVQAGDAVDQQIETLRPLVERGDILMDGGNANFRDTVRRTEALAGTGIRFLGVGVSGGEEGARHGPSIMSGGEREGYDRVEPILTAISAKKDGEPCSAYLGSDGAGHFVKTLHNGIEYADMQIIAETYAVMRHVLGISPAEMADQFAAWNKGPLESYLIEITAEILAAVDTETGSPVIDLVLDRAGEKGTGRWASAESLDLGVPAPTIFEAVAARAVSAAKDQRVAAAKIYDPIITPDTTNAAALKTSLEGALLAGKIAAYAQGFAVMAAASERHAWNLPFDTIARIWREGCIIRSRFLNSIAEAYGRTPDLANLLVEPSFVEIMTKAHGDLRKVISGSIAAGLPTPALSSALAYFDSYRRARLSADMIQAQRDFFGAHTFQRTDKPGSFHYLWSQGGGWES
ncbi:MAG: NADP-dependent phosphogluconate dehydrogenase [Pseudomonadota bacterium]